MNKEKTEKKRVELRNQKANENNLKYITCLVPLPEYMPPH